MPSCVIAVGVGKDVSGELFCWVKERGWLTPDVYRREEHPEMEKKPTKRNALVDHSSFPIR